jgi:hypothetical protein
MPVDNNEFFKNMFEEKKMYIAERTNYVSRKIVLITTFSGFGSLGNYNGVFFFPLLFFVPLIAIAYDLYINAADSRIKQWGYFVRDDNNKYLFSDAELKWESYMASERGKNAPLANLILSIVCVLFSYFILFYYLIASEIIVKPLLLLWAVFMIGIIYYVNSLHRDHVLRLDQTSGYKSN